MLPLGYLLMAAAAIATYAVLSIGPVEFVASPPPYGLNACTACGLRPSVLCPTSLFAHLEVSMQFCSTLAPAPCCCPTRIARSTSDYDGFCPRRDAETCQCTFRQVPEDHVINDITVKWKASLATIFVLASFSVWMYRALSLFRDNPKQQAPTT